MVVHDRQAQAQILVNRNVWTMLVLFSSPCVQRFGEFTIYTSHLHLYKFISPVGLDGILTFTAN